MPVQWSRLLGLLPDAQSRSSHSDAGDGGRAVARLREGRRRFTGYVNARAGETGHLFQGWFGCVAMDETHCLNAVRHLALNPVRARLSATPGDWPWSSARAHLRGRDDALVSVRPLLELAPNFAEPLALSLSNERWPCSSVCPWPI